MSEEQAKELTDRLLDRLGLPPHYWSIVYNCLLESQDVFEL